MLQWKANGIGVGDRPCGPEAQRDFKSLPTFHRTQQGAALFAERRVGAALDGLQIKMATIDGDAGPCIAEVDIRVCEETHFTRCQPKADLAAALAIIHALDGTL